MTDITLRRNSTPAAKVRTAVPTALYDGRELQRNPGLTEERFDAFNLPSRMSGHLVYPKRRV